MRTESCGRFINRDNQQGFTLVELLVVMAVLAILAGIAVPKFGSVLAGSRTRADTVNKSMILEALALYQTQEARTDENIKALEDVVDTLVTEGYLQQAPLDPQNESKIYTCKITGITGGKYTCDWGFKDKN